MGRRQSYFKNAAILTGTGLVLRFAGMLFRVYLAGRLGGEGMGLYQLIYSLYNLAIAAATAGVSVASARLAAEQLAKGEAAAVLGVQRRVMAAALALGAGAGVMQLLLAKPAARFWLGDERAARSLAILAPSLPFMAAAAVLRGYFLARRRAMPGAKAQLLEQAVRIGLSAALLRLAPTGQLEGACAALMLANTLSEAASCLLLAGFYRRDCRRAFAGVQPVLPAGTSRRLRAILWPVESGRCLAGALQAAENMLVPACIGLYLHSREAALAQYGALKGMALPLLFFPFSFLSALSTLLMPEITRAHLAGQQGQLQNLIGRMVFFTMVMALPAAGLFAVYGPVLGLLLYKDRQVGWYIRILGPLMPCLYLESMVDGVLKGLGQQLATLRYSLWDSLVRIGGVVLLLPRWGMPGFLLVMAVSNLLTGTLNTRRMLRVSGVRMQWGRWVLCPALALGLALTAARLLIGPALALPRLALETGVTGAVYGGLLLPLGLGRELQALRPRSEAGKTKPRPAGVADRRPGL